MLRINTKILSTLIFLGSAGAATAQQEDVILTAMKDELNRNMTELSLKDHSKPFFIGYGIDDYKVYTAYGTLGSIINASDVKRRSKNVRILVGDYEFNDESLDNNLYSEPGVGEIELPLEDDYYGIRRSLWVTTDIVYKSAAKKYQKHIDFLKEQNKTLGDLPHRTFAKVPVITYIGTEQLKEIDVTQYNQYVKEISGIFRSMPEITYSGVFLTAVRGYRYFVNSEGIVTKTSNQIATIRISAGVQTPKGAMDQKQLVFYARTPDGLPQLADVIKETRAMTASLLKEMDAEPITEDYVGPVLFIGESVGSIFERGFFSMEEGLNATNRIRTPNSYTQEFNATLESKIGKSIVDQSITVTAKPTLAEFQGVPLLGTFEIDEEGVRPEKQLTLIENGVLRNLLNDRSLTNTNQKANGFSGGPGVVETSIAAGVTQAALKEKLIQTAKQEGMEYAMIVRGPTFRAGMVNVYKVSLENGTETLMRSAQIQDISIRSLKKIGGASKDKQVVNLTLGGMSSLICPQALLLNDITILPAHVPYFETETYVESPLKKTN